MFCFFVFVCCCFNCTLFVLSENAGHPQDGHRGLGVDRPGSHGAERGARQGPTADGGVPPQTRRGERRRRSAKTPARPESHRESGV